MSVLKAGGNTNSSKSEEVLKGVYAKELEILEAKDVSKVENNFGKSYDLAIELKLKDGEYETTRTIQGNFKYDNGLMIGWGAAFVIDNLLKSLEIYKMFSKEELEEVTSLFEQSKVSSSILRALKGKKIWSFSYIKGIEDGKKKYGSYTKFNPDKEKLLAMFKADIAAGYPDSYHPELLNQDTVPFNIPVAEDAI